MVDDDGRETVRIAGTGSDGDGQYVSFERGLDAGYAADEATLRPTEATLRDEVVGPRETLREWGFDPRTFVLPYDASDARAWSLVCDRYDALANAAVRSLPNPPGTPPTSLRRYYLETDQLTRTGVGDYLDAVADVGGLGVLAGHSAWETVPPERVRWVVAAARDRGIELATFRDVPG